VMYPSYDLLIEHLSALRRGNWKTFKAAVRAVATRNEQGEIPRWMSTVVATSLSALGHAEISFDDSLDWEIAPAAIVGSPSLRPGHGFLCGTRTTTFMDAVQAAAAERGVDWTIVPQNNAPSAVFLHGSNDDDLAAVATRACVPFEADCAGRMLRCLPTLTSLYRAAPPAGLPHGFDTKRFDPESMMWQPVEAVEGNGSFLFDAYRPEYRVVHDGLVKKVSRSVAVYHALAQARKSVMTSSNGSDELAVPARADLPPLYMRTLVLYSGRVPTYDNGRLRYSLVPPMAAAMVKRGLESGEDHG